MAVSGIILAGGRSLRMGRDKTLLLYKSETLIERAVKTLRSIVDEIIIASNHIEKYSIPGVLEVPDVYSGKGPLGGMHAGLSAAQYEYAFVISCDMPFYSEKVALHLLDRRNEYDAIVPEICGRWEPLCAVYSKKCVEPITNCLQADVKKVSLFYQQIRVLKINESELRQYGDINKMFYNLNTPEDLSALDLKEKQVVCSRRAYHDEEGNKDG
ncbi:putative molybdenum cofactor guanylyltransferase [bioreactor metagenome]|uniref:Putative molybdenum cofactor guanylyltransferase n=1 Tax=bioreactor metagenome TaxID=1076179 RepID=A0A644THS5_9ZZZZ|nr:molybdenum cofactor guanylyltransferase [Negativicutes bacterium]